MTSIYCESWCQMDRPREPESGAGARHCTLRGAASRSGIQRSKHKEHPVMGLGDCS